MYRVELSVQEEMLQVRAAYVSPLHRLIVLHWYVLAEVVEFAANEDTRDKAIQFFRRE